MPDIYDNDGHTSLVGLHNQQWNHVVWEIPHLAPNKVTALVFECRRQGNEPEAGDTLTFDIDHLAIERVEPDYWEGWAVARGRIFFSHTGYRTGSHKTAVASALSATRFELIDQGTGEVALSKPVDAVQSAIGRFQLMDFPEFSKPGRYVLRAGAAVTRPLAIGDDVWRRTIWKVINFFRFVANNYFGIISAGSKGRPLAPKCSPRRSTSAARRAATP